MSAYVETAWLYAIKDGIRLDIIDVNVRGVAYYQRMGYVVLPGSSFIHPLLRTPSEVMVCTVDPDTRGTLRKCFDSCTSPLRLHNVLREVKENSAGRSLSPRYQGKSQSPSSRALVPGTVLSFSAGTFKADPEKYRIVVEKPGKLQQIAVCFPRLARFFSRKPPVVINAYPAPVGPIPLGVTVDSYGRPPTVSGALLLARREAHPAILIGMPLMIAHMLVEHIRKELGFPGSLLIFVGGYLCPSSLENYIRNLLRGHGVDVEIVHLYGVAEIDSALLAAMDRTPDNQLVYFPIDNCWIPLVSEGKLCFCNRDGPEVDPVVVDEYADNMKNGIILRNREDRVSPNVLSELESWSSREWSRRTGHLGIQSDGLFFQLRNDCTREATNEIDHHDFAKWYDFSWLDKPRWA